MNTPSWWWRAGDLGMRVEGTEDSDYHCPPPDPRNLPPGTQESKILATFPEGVGGPGMVGCFYPLIWTLQSLGIRPCLSPSIAPLSWL